MRLQGRTIAAGRAGGPALVLDAPLSFLGGIDRETGRLLAPGAHHGESVTGRVLVFPRGKGSTAGSYILYALRVRGKAPAALVCQEAEAVVATGAILSETPMVDQIRTDLLRTGDVVTVDGDTGIVDLEGIGETHVVTSFLTNEGEVLILRRSEEVGSFPGHWAGVSGYVEGAEDPLVRARLEMEEETGITDATLLNAGEVVRVRGTTGDVVWAVHPFLFEVADRHVTLDWEHLESRWIAPETLPEYRTVPKLEAALHSALAGVTAPSSPRP